MKNLFYFIPVLILSLGILSCERNIPTGPETKELRELDVPTNFNWSNGLEAGLVVNLQNTNGLETEGRIMQLMDDQSRVIQIARVSSNKVSFTAEIPGSVPRVFLFFPMTRTKLEIDNIAGLRNLTMDLGSMQAVAGPELKFDGIANCDENCDRTVSGSVTYLAVAKNETVCLTGTLSGGLKINDGGTLRICGHADIIWTDISSKNQATIIVSNTGSITSSGFYLSGSKHSLINFGEISLTNYYNLSGIIENHGEMEVKGLEVFPTGTLDNSGSFTSNAEVNIKGTLNNLTGGYFSIPGSSHSLNISNKGSLVNHCRFLIGNNLNLGDGFLTNNGYIRIDGWFYGNAKEDVLLGNLSMISVENFQPNCSFICANGAASVKVDSKTNIDSKTVFEGLIDICDANGIDNIWTSSGKLPGNVTQCDIYIPAGNCNPEGIGSPAVQDADGDGIVDDEDEFPTDPDRAFSTLEPYSGYKIWAFEDLWPSIGDYDFNDLVIATRIEYILNADMKPVEAEVEVEIRAIGAGLPNGLGLQFLSSNLPEGQLIAGVEGSAVKIDDQIRNGLILTNDVMAAISPKYNNNGVGPKNKPEIWSFKVIFNSATVNNSSLMSDFYIFRRDDRGHEVHIAGRPGTAAADQSLFGTGEDATHAGNNYWYKTTNGIPWGISLLALDKDWNHPIEKISILEAYPDFEIWATSGGSTNINWFTKGIYEKCFHQ